ncbi:hypothetical protein EP073_04380 [Geovibrio thiophilus]|uniref:Molecular chaperone TorD n=1 Tax=Geovibrio thiophilus TaxID=139438 RepID=A0A3R5XWA5_9BACT|nr:molecular chaperone TorD family protein [Geovibrio thiophilus]QAR32671.1 hypothetical protein EP073_04380 [Geovibrio thiophilus]
MSNTAEYTDISINRSNMFSFLARLYKVEADESLIKSIIELPEMEEGTAEFIEGIKAMKSCLTGSRTDIVTELAVDYACVFLGAGKAETELSAYPYQSVYTSPKKLLMQDARDKVLAVYRKFGLDRSERYNEPEDHIFFELEFMSELCKRLYESEIKKEHAESLSLLKAQKAFITEHLLKWVPAFCRDVEKIAATGFYKGAAKVTSAYLHMDLAVTEELISDCTAGR